MIKDFSRADYTNKNCYSNIKMRTWQSRLPKTTAIQLSEKKWQSWLRQQNCYSIYKKIAELAAPTKLPFKLYIEKWQSRLSKNNCYKIYFKMAEQAVKKQLLYNLVLKMAELAAPTKLLYNMRVWHIISHFFGGN